MLPTEAVLVGEWHPILPVNLKLVKSAGDLQIRALLAMASFG
jgi:hypothetical protein